MCGRFTLRASVPELLSTFVLNEIPTVEPRFNIAPTQEVGVVRWDTDAGSRTWNPMQWGLVPSWAKDARGGGRLINARSESVDVKPSFRSAFKRRRCLIPADGYYEWRANGQAKQPFLIHLADDRPFAFAGLWEIWRDPQADAGAEPLLSCTILTTEANPLAAGIHPRMPVILAPEQQTLWLDPELETRAPLAELMQPYAGDDLRIDEVDRYVNHARHEGPRCVSPPSRPLFD